MLRVRCRGIWIRNEVRLESKVVGEILLRVMEGSLVRWIFRSYEVSDRGFSI